MSNYLKLAGIVLIASVMTVGCNKGSDSSAPVGEAELFAKAQEFQKDEKFDDAVKTYRQIIREYSKSKQAANSQFMIGYIYANHIKDYEQGKIELQRFIDNYGAVADSGLVAGANFELQWMGKDIEDIPILSNIGEADGDTATATK